MAPSDEPSTSFGLVHKNTQTEDKKHCSICREDIDEQLWAQHLGQDHHKKSFELFLKENMKAGPISNKIYSIVNKDKSILDVNLLFERNSIALIELLQAELNELLAIKFKLELIAMFVKDQIDEDCAEIRRMPTKMAVLLKSDNISEKLKYLVGEILVELEECEETYNGSFLMSLKEIKIYVYQYSPSGQGSQYSELPSPDADKIQNIANPLVLKDENDKAKILKFTNFFKQIDHPFVVYVDFKYLSQSACEKSSTTDVPQRELCGFSYFIKCSFDAKYEKQITYIGEMGKNTVDKFTEMLVKDLRRLYDEVFAVEKPMIELTDKERKTFENSDKCHICEIGGLKKDTAKEMDYCRLTGVYRGAAHKKCIRAYRVRHFFPVILPNLLVYDCHQLAKSLSKHNGHISVIPLNENSYLSLIKDIICPGNTKFSIRFLNSTRFLNATKFLQSSLDSMANKVDGLVNTKKHFSNNTLMLRKGVFPSNYLDKWERLNESSLPPKEMFCNELNESECSQEDYDHAESVWTLSECVSLKDYLNSYLKGSVLLFTDFFEYFRKLCKSVYGLDPCQYFTTPGLSWDAMLRTVKEDIELLTDTDIYNFFKSSIRGGLCYCSHRHAVANNKYLDGYSKKEKSQYLMFYDANNSYGWAMSQPLPTGNFEWEESHLLKNYTEKYIKGLEDEKVGYVLEVDLRYSTGLHDSHNDLPFCPEKTITPPGGTFYKLTANLNDKTKYTIHLKNLQQCLKNGLKLVKVHRVLKFSQSVWLKAYIELNTEQRKLATNAFEKDFFKLMNNCIYGKSIENVNEKRTDVLIVIDGENDKKDARLKIAHPNFQSENALIPGVTSFEFKKTNIKRDKPIYLGFVVLELSKWLMYDFHYGYMKKKFPKIRVNYTDTDSFMYSIWTEDFYEDIYRDVRDDPVKCRFDTSDYPEDNPHRFPLQNGKVPGRFKDEANSKKIVEFVGLMAKMYAYNLKDGDKVKVDNYRMLLKDCTDTKRYIREDGVSTYAWGHYKLL